MNQHSSRQSLIHTHPGKSLLTGDDATFVMPFDTEDHVTPTARRTNHCDGPGW